MKEQLTRSMQLQSRAVPGLTRLSAAFPLIGVIVIGLVASLSAFAIVWTWEARTGYSSLKYLATYPLNRLKLAQELVFRVMVDYRNAAVVRNAIRLAHELGIEVMAEGVETDAQIRFLIEAGCEQAQGFYFSAPLTVEAVTALLRKDFLDPARRSGQRLRISAA
jgi:predicted signal transduction protein with EAL and GGDEF domain